MQQLLIRKNTINLTFKMCETCKKIIYFFSLKLLVHRLYKTTCVLWTNLAESSSWGRIRNSHLYPWSLKHGLYMWHGNLLRHSFLSPYMCETERLKRIFSVILVPISHLLKTF